MKSQTVLKLVMMGMAIILFQATYAQQPDKHNDKPSKSKESSWVKESGIKSSTTNVYFPNQNVYYNVSKKTYIYEKDGKWQESSKTPKTMKNVDMKSAKKVELDRKTDKPQAKNSDDRKNYGGGSGASKSDHGTGMR